MLLRHARPHAGIPLCTSVRSIALSIVMMSPLALQAQQPKSAGGVPAAMSAIREADLKRDLYLLAGDGMRGREAGTVDEMRASMWIAEQLRTIGVKPAGQDGSYFQWWNMVVTRISTASSEARIGGKSLALWKEIVPRGNGISDTSGPTVWVGDGSDTTIDVRGKIAVIQMVAPAATAVRTTTNSYEVRYTQAALTATTARLQGRGAAAIIIVADSIGDLALEPLGILGQRGTQDVVGGASRFANQAAPPTARAVASAPRNAQTPSFLVARSMGTALRTASVPAEFHVRVERFETPSCNIVGPGVSDSIASGTSFTHWSSCFTRPAMTVPSLRPSEMSPCSPETAVTATSGESGSLFTNSPPPRR